MSAFLQKRLTVAPTRNGVKGQRRLSGRLWVELAGYRRSYLFEMFKRDLGFSGTVKPTSSAQHFLISRNSFAARGYRARSKRFRGSANLHPKRVTFPGRMTCRRRSASKPRAADLHTIAPPPSTLSTSPVP